MEEKKEKLMGPKLGCTYVAEHITVTDANDQTTLL